MKFLLLITMSCIFLLGCEKEEVPIFFPGEMENGRMQSEKNGKGWISSATGYFDSYKPSEYFGILTFTYSEEGFQREVVGFGEIPLAVGRYPVSLSLHDYYDGFVGASYNTNEDDGDAGEDSYIVRESSDNWLEVTYVDTIEGIARGKFDVTFDIYGEKQNSANPDKVRFSNGTFEVNIKDP